MIGGVFLLSRDPVHLVEWYKRPLGLGPRVSPR
jgi:hypothetical protein